VLESLENPRVIVAAANRDGSRSDPELDAGLLPGTTLALWLPGLKGR
jgi:hypothetical protein